jgi:hypothetical protein
VPYPACKKKLGGCPQPVALDAFGNAADRDEINPYLTWPLQLPMRSVKRSGKIKHGVGAFVHGSNGTKSAIYTTVLNRSKRIASRSRSG